MSSVIRDSLRCGMLDKLEPEARALAGEFNPDYVVDASAAISLKRIADTLEKLDAPSEQGDSLAQKIYYAIYNPLQDAMAAWVRR